MDERLKILEMLKNGNITVSEADELLQTIEDIDNKKESKCREKFNKFNESLKVSLNKFGEEVKKINSEGIKESLKKGYDEVNEAFSKLDEELLHFIKGDKDNGREN